MPEYKPAMPALAEALEEFMKAAVQPALQGKQAYEARIAANLLAIIKRELQQGEASRDAEQRDLQELLGRQGTPAELNDELCRNIRCAEMDYRDGRLMGFLRCSVMSRLAIDNPSYSAYRKALEIT
jgi:hypothetical protein